MPQTLFNGAHFAVHGAWSNGRPIISSFHAIVFPVGDRTAAVQEAAVRFSTQWFSAILPILADNYSYDGVNWVDLHSEDGATGFAGRTAASGGGVGTAHTPASLGALVTKNFAGAGRSKRTGRTFLPGVLESGVDENGALTSGTQTQINTAFESLRVGFNASAPVGAIASCTLVVAHAPSISVTRTRTVRVPDPDGAMTSDAITSFSCDVLTSGVRRRIRG